MFEELIGAPFEDGGRSPEGFDCWGLICYIYKTRLQIELPHYGISAFDQIAVSKKIEEEKHNWFEVKVPEAYDLVAVCMCDDQVAVVNHVGMHMGRGRMIHASQLRGTEITRITHQFWQRRVRSFHRWMR